MRRLWPLVALLVCAASSRAQSGAPPLGLRVVARADSSVYLYATSPATAGRGFIFYRRTGAGPFVRLNATPTRAIESSYVFADSVGSAFEAILDQTRQADTTAAYARLVADPVAGSLLAFQNPAVARALGRLYVDPLAPLGTRVTYRVAQVDALDTPTGETAEVTLTLTPTRPDPPTGLTAESEGTRGTLRWRYAPNRRGEDDRVIGFNAYSAGAGRPRTRLNERIVLRDEGTDRFTIPFTADSTGQPLAFTVEALDVTGQPSEAARLDYTPPDNDPPGLIESVAALARPDGAVEITWPPGVDADLAGYHVYRAASVQDTVGIVRLNPTLIAPFEPVFVDAGATGPGARTFAYRVAAVDRAGNEGRRSNAAVAEVEDHVPPAPPEALSGTLGSAGVALRWQVREQAPDLATYLVFRRQIAPGAPGNEARLNAGPVKTTAYNDANAPEEGATYRYRVAALDSTNNVSASDSILVFVANVTPPAAPPSLIARVDTWGQVTIQWSPSGSSDVVAYALHRIEGADTTLLGRVPAPGSEWEDEAARIGASYLYRVAAIDEAGNVSAPMLSSPVSVRDGEAPRVVRNVQVVAGTAGVLVAWEPVPSEDLAGYRVLRSSIATGRYDVVQDVALSAPGVPLEWTDSAGRAGMWYRVVAVDTSGNESEAPAPVQAAPMRQ